MILQQHHELPSTLHSRMVGPRSSLRRPNRRDHSHSHKSSASRSSSPLNDDPPPLLPKSGNEGIALRSKRLRTATLSAPEHDLKRRRLSSHKDEIPQLRIPLRSRGGLPRAIPQPPPATVASNVRPPQAVRPAAANIDNRPINFPTSPSEKPQYDQIRIIEETAKASIRRGGVSTTIAEDRRKLRSEDGGSRAKTELAQYFPDFEDMLSLKPLDPGMVDMLPADLIGFNTDVI